MCITGVEQRAYFMERFLEFSIRLSVKQCGPRLHAVKPDHASH
jgi:hypothetical protein